MQGRNLIFASAALAASINPASANCLNEALSLAGKLDGLETRLEEMVKGPKGVAGACKVARAALPDLNRAETLLKTCPALGFVRDAKLVEISTARGKFKSQCS